MFRKINDSGGRREHFGDANHSRRGGPVWGQGTRSSISSTVMVVLAVGIRVTDLRRRPGTSSDIQVRVNQSRPPSPLVFWPNQTARNSLPTSVSDSSP